LIYSSFINKCELCSKSKKWLGDHPFILTAIDSKGLEFDDVVIAIEAERSAWNMNLRRSVSLKLLREMYVAITRAKCLAIILVKKKCDKMKFFFHLLNCDIDFFDARTSFVEFDNESSMEEWLIRAHDLLKDERFQLAASCFRKAQIRVWRIWSLALYNLSIRNKNEAINLLRESSKLFYHEENFALALDALQLISANDLWVESDNDIFEKSIEKLPHHLPRIEVIKIDICRDNWESITLDEMKEKELKQFIDSKRQSPRLRRKLRSFTRDALILIENIFPCIIGDIHYEMQRYDDALRLYLSTDDSKSAILATKTLLKEFKLGKDEEMILNIINLWRNKEQKVSSTSKSEDFVNLLISLFEDPVKAANDNSRKLMLELDPDIIKFAVSHKKLDPTTLHLIHCNEFHDIDLYSLEQKYASNSSKIIEWFAENNDRRHALSITFDNLKK